MRNSVATWSDQRIRAIIGNLLRAGVLIAAAVTSSVESFISRTQGNR